ncbi:MAG: cytochrome c biogenesis protein CcsA [Bacteroidota bacterium]
MNEIVFEGERLIWGNLGHLAVILSFATSICATLSWYISVEKADASWASVARKAFHLHTVSVLSIIGVLFYIIHQHYFEYHYAWQHSSRDLPVEYMISCFWEGQEGSFLLWIFWQMVIGNILLYTAGERVGRVMSVLMLSQVALTSMLIGVEVLGYKVGSSPFELLRNAMANAPIFSQPDYLSKITDGNGLNPLLQNYWMVIHPPTLFFGFATTIVPFAFAISAMWQRDYTSWLKPALPWALISVMVLGTGIIMGGFWAYESLSFGGYWAWDPVENASLIPWLILIAGVHVMLVYKHSGNALTVSFLLILATFLLVLYATFLTRSGILGNSSVHSFTDLGMSGQLLVFMMLFVWLPGFVCLSNVRQRLFYSALFTLFIGSLVLTEKWDVTKWISIVTGSAILIYSAYLTVRSIPNSESEEQVYTREFWMFIGSLILVISAFQVIITTSIPVFNKMFGANLAPPSDVIMHYNKWQMPIAILIALLTGISQLLKYKKNTRKAAVHLLMHAGIALVAAVSMKYYFKLDNWFYLGLLFAAAYTLSANIQLLKPLLRGRIMASGSSVAHIGFGILLLGVLVSSANKEVISINNTQMQLNPEFDEAANREHVLLERGKPMLMGEYEIEYRKDTQIWVNTYYQVHYKRIEPSTNKVLYEFDLYPNAQVNPKMGLVANPDTKHYISHDVFTYVSSIPKEKETDKFINTQKHEVRKGDTVVTNVGYITVNDIVSNKRAADYTDKMEIALTAQLTLKTLNAVYTAAPIYGISSGQVVDYPALIEEAGLRIRFTGVNPQTGKISLETAEQDTSGDFIIMKAIVFPWINLVWGGTILMIIGFLLAIYRRITNYQTGKI